MQGFRVLAAVAAAVLMLVASAARAASPAGCSVPADRLLHRLDIDLPGVARVTRSVDVPADAEILVEAFETGVNARIEVRESQGTEASAETGLHRWPPHRLIIAKGPARKVDLSVIGMERAHGRVDVRLSKLASHRDRRCVDFLRAMATGDAAFAQGAKIFRSEIEAAPGAAERAYESALAAYARAAGILGPGYFDEAQTQLVRSAVLMWVVERHQQAYEVARIAESSFAALGHAYGRDLARFYWAHSLILVTQRTTDPAEAKRQFEIAERELREVAASHLRRGERFEQALALDGMAYASGHLFRYAEAISGYQRSLDILEELGEPDRAVGTRYNLAYFEAQFGRYHEALKRHMEILAEGDNVKDPIAYVFNIRSIAFLELKLGKYDDALRRYSDAHARSLRMQTFRDQARALYGLGNTYHAIGNYSEALNYLERSLELRRDEQTPREVGITLRTLANVLGDIGRGREAIARREEALRTSQIAPEKARITLELIEDRLEAGDLAVAKTLTASLLATRDFPDPGVRVGATLASARIALAEGDATAAESNARIAAEYYRGHELVSQEFAALLVQARAACAAGMAAKAREIGGLTLQRAEEIRAFSSNPALRASLWRTVRPAFGFAIGTMARANSCGGNAPADALGALALAEGSRARALGDYRNAWPAPPDPKMSERRRMLFEQLAGARQQIESLASTVSADDERLKILRTEAARLRREIDLSGGLPDASRNRSADLRPALRARIDAIPPDTAVVEYWVGKDEAFAWLLTRGRVQLVDLGPAERIDAAARRMHDAMRGWLEGSVAERMARARELHRLIIAPLPGGMDGVRTVYFIPDGALHAVPFAALAHGDVSRPRFLVDSHDIAVAPAFLAIASERGRRKLDTHSTALVVVDPVYARDDGRFTGSSEADQPAVSAATTLRGPQSWRRLPATAREAATLSGLLASGSVQVLSGFDASRDSLLRRDLGRFDILHFATHAIADTEAPQLSALVLSTFDAQGRPRAGEVFAGDLVDQRLGAGLVVFSGCETALGRAEAGEGLLGLRYAAHASGASTVVASLWPVMDAAGAGLVDRLYGEVIGRDTPPVAALSRAMRSVRTRWNDPALWASFDVSIAGF
jgi:CHAT domain-containing protein/tetratricopeptide (TPR) repeat protein